METSDAGRCVLMMSDLTCIGIATVNHGKTKNKLVEMIQSERDVIARRRLSQLLGIKFV